MLLRFPMFSVYTWELSSILGSRYTEFNFKVAAYRLALSPVKLMLALNPELWAARVSAPPVVTPLPITYHSRAGKWP
jgi:hypothetical protein